jgi:hypothetical protein
MRPHSWKSFWRRATRTHFPQQRKSRAPRSTKAGPQTSPWRRRGGDEPRALRGGQFGMALARLEFELVEKSGGTAPRSKAPLLFVDSRCPKWAPRPVRRAWRCVESRRREALGRLDELDLVQLLGCVFLDDAEDPVDYRFGVGSVHESWAATGLTVEAEAPGRDTDDDV